MPKVPGPSNALPFSGLGAARAGLAILHDVTAATTSAATACSTARTVLDVGPEVTLA
jgi:hypothetical protein